MAFAVCLHLLLFQGQRTMTQVWICLTTFAFVAALATFLASMNASNIFIRVAAGIELWVNLMTAHFQPAGGFAGPVENKSQKAKSVV